MIDYSSSKMYTMKKILLAICLFVWVGSLTAQVQKNDWLIGGSTKFSSNKTADLKTTMFEFSPNAGYFFVNNFAVGLRAGISSVKLEGTDAVSSSLFSPFLRYYFLPAANKVNFMLDGSFGVGSTSAVGETISQNGFGLAAGPAIFLNKHTALEFTLGYNSIKYEADPDRSNTFTIGVGFQVHLLGSKK
jgi:hypothetical protein